MTLPTLTFTQMAEEIDLAADLVPPDVGKQLRVIAEHVRGFDRLLILAARKGEVHREEDRDLGKIVEQTLRACDLHAVAEAEEREARKNLCCNLDELHRKLR